MQAVVEDITKAFARAEMGLPGKAADEDALHDFGFHYPIEHIWGAFTRYYRSGFQALPDAGGYFDQDAHLMNDFETLTRLVNFYARRVKAGASAAGNLPDDEAGEVDPLTLAQNRLPRFDEEGGWM